MNKYIGRRKPSGFGQQTIHAYDPKTQIGPHHVRAFCGVSSNIGNVTQNGAWKTTDRETFDAKSCMKCIDYIRSRESTFTSTEGEQSVTLHVNHYRPLLALVRARIDDKRAPAAEQNLMREVEFRLQRELNIMSVEAQAQKVSEDAGV